jgi:release factor glutamine methyltransferase
VSSLLNFSVSEYLTTVSRIIAAIGSPLESVYAPSEDSFLMLHALSNVDLRDLTVCDVGTGSGILGLFCALRGAGEVTVTDINELALRETVIAAERLGIKVEPILSDLLSGLDNRFDLIVFNPPYLPSEEVVDRSIDGGPKGLLLIRRFLGDLPNHLNQNGHALLLLSSLNNPEEVVSGYSKFAFQKFATRRVFFEELQVLDLRFRDNLVGKRLDR